MRRVCTPKSPVPPFHLHHFSLFLPVRLREVSEKLNKYSYNRYVRSVHVLSPVMWPLTPLLSFGCVFFHPSHPHLGLLEQATLKQCVVGPNHAGFLLEVISFYSAMITCCLHPQKKGFLYIGDVPNLAVSYFSVTGFEGLWRFGSD